MVSFERNPPKYGIVKKSKTAKDIYAVVMNDFGLITSNGIYCSDFGIKIALILVLTGQYAAKILSPNWSLVFLLKVSV